MLRIAQVMKEEGRSQAWLAQRLGISQGLVSRLLQGTRYWTEEHKRRAIEALGRESGNGLFEVVDGVECPLCGGRKSVWMGTRVVRCRLCRGLGQVTREKLAEVVSAEFIPEGI